MIFIIDNGQDCDDHGIDFVDAEGYKTRDARRLLEKIVRTPKFFIGIMPRSGLEWHELTIPLSEYVRQDCYIDETKLTYTHHDMDTLDDTEVDVLEGLPARMVVQLLQELRVRRSDVQLKRLDSMLKRYKKQVHK